MLTLLPRLLLTGLLLTGVLLLLLPDMRLGLLLILRDLLLLCFAPTPGLLPETRGLRLMLLLIDLLGLTLRLLPIRNPISVVGGK